MLITNLLENKDGIDSDFVFLADIGISADGELEVIDFLSSSHELFGGFRLEILEQAEDDNIAAGSKFLGISDRVDGLSCRASLLQEPVDDFIGRASTCVDDSSKSGQISTTNMEQVKQTIVI